MIYASISAVITAYLVYIFDRYERESLIVLWFAIFLGMLSTLLPFVVVKIFPFLAVRNPVTLGGVIFTSFVSAAAVEELSKFALFLIILYRWKSINEFYDVMLYFGMIGIGFGIYENFLYIMGNAVKALNLNYTEALVRKVALTTAAVRITPAHFLFNFIAGYFIAHGFYRKKKGFFLAGLLLAVVLHGSYNTLAFLSPLRLWILFIFLMIATAYLLGKDALRRSVFRPESLSDLSTEERAKILQKLREGGEKVTAGYLLLIIILILGGILITLFLTLFVNLIF